MTKLTKRFVARKLTDFKFDFGVSILELTEQLNAIHKKYPKKTVTLDVEYHDYNDGNPEYFFSYEELETDEEFNSRVEYEKERERVYREEKEKKQAREKELAEFHKLKRKLGIWP